ncbi:hypothetical protein [Mucilaginibacter myungsuensis]|uniref:Uncharacterized protein n=1 Tax=Mucilaginibacter myungsuensis TaxID=649104 RepID=A0A929PWP2_9SPHI|nr:hypothetical protein [Mucilaginibacter myungsuensis]MBE9662344.1 hypothetical protein [Mucilaginibacter myungsuensis]MDN3599219.1 hypothetical protein [Mucilaginibacter myungsuensis]
MKKKNFIGKLLLKMTSKTAYKKYKWDMVNYQQNELNQYLIGNNKLTDLNKIKAVAAQHGELNLTHSGNAGDIIYALPTIKRIYQETNVPINFLLKLGRPMNLSNYSEHSMGNVMLNQKTADLIKPLIEGQSYINSCRVYNNEVIHIDLDFFRSGLVPQNRGNIARWCSYITGASPKLYEPWLTVEPDASYKDTIVLARSARYQNQNIDHSILAKHKLVFLGVESEYKAMKKLLPDLQWQPVDDFLHMARIIAGSKFFIGNQSFPYSIAEGLKTPRLLEVSYEVINVVPEGPNGYDFLFQEHFASLVEELSR